MSFFQGNRQTKNALLLRERAAQNAFKNMAIESDFEGSDLADDSLIPLMSADYSLNAGDISIASAIEFNEGFNRVDTMARTMHTSRVDELAQLIEKQTLEIKQQSEIVRAALRRDFAKIDETIRHNEEVAKELPLRIIERVKRETAERERLAEEKRKAEEYERQQELKRQMEEERIRQLEMRKREEEQKEAERKEQEKNEKLRQEAEAKALEERQEKELQRKREEEKQKEEAVKKENAKIAAEKRRETNLYSDWSAVEKEFTHYKSIIQEMKDLTKNINSDKAMKSFCFNQRTAIRPKLGQLTTSTRHVLQISQEIDQILNEVKDKHSNAYTFVMNNFAKMIVKQAEVEIVANVQQSIPLGMMVTNVLAKHPELIDILMARFVKKAPQIIGYSCPIDTEKGRKDMGWRKDNDNWELETKYLERIGAICQVWTVITITSVEKLQLVHPYTIEHSWRFLARHVNKPHSQPADYQAVASWWEIACQDLVQAYGTQAQKLLRLICTDWSSSKTNAPAKRLTIMGEDWMKSGKLALAWQPLAP